MSGLLLRNLLVLLSVAISLCGGQPCVAGDVALTANQCSEPNQLFNNTVSVLPGTTVTLNCSLVDTGVNWNSSQFTTVVRVDEGKESAFETGIAFQLSATSSDPLCASATATLNSIQISMDGLDLTCYTLAGDAFISRILFYVIDPPALVFFNAVQCYSNIVISWPGTSVGPCPISNYTITINDNTMSVPGTETQCIYPISANECGSTFQISMSATSAAGTGETKTMNLNTVSPCVPLGQLQVDSLSCEQFCLSAQVTCTCTVTGPTLQWRVLDATGSSLGLETLNIDCSMGDPKTLTGASAFEALLTSSTGDTLTGTLTFITISEYEGYMIECNTASSSAMTIPITIPGAPLPVTELGLAGFTTASVMLTFTPPANSPCIANYTITTVASAPSSTTNTTVIISRPTSYIEGDTYSVGVTPVDVAGRMGTLTSLQCFIFSGPNAVSFSGVSFGTKDGVCAGLVEWTSSECLPEISSYFVTTSSTDEVENETISTSSYTLNDIFVGEMYSVTVVPSNVLGLGSPTSTIIIVPTVCPTMPVENPPTTDEPTSISSTNAPTTGVATAIVIGVACGVVGLLVIVIVVVGILLFIFKQKSKHRKGTSPAPAPKKPERTSRGSKQAKADEADAHRSLPENQNPSQGVYADISHDPKKTSKPGPKSSEQVIYSGIAHPRQLEYAALEMGRGGEIPQKPEGVVYSEVNN